MTRAQYDARVGEMLREYARVFDPHGPVGHRTTSEYHAGREITAFVRQFWRDEWYPAAQRGVTDGC